MMILQDNSYSTNTTSGVKFLGYTGNIEIKVNDGEWIVHNTDESFVFETEIRKIYILTVKYNKEITTVAIQSKLDDKDFNIWIPSGTKRESGALLKDLEPPLVGGAS